KIEDLMGQLMRDYTIVIVTHNMQQAARVSDFTAFMLMNPEGRYGELIEFAPTADIFNQPQDQRTEAYITGRFGSHMPRLTFERELASLRESLVRMGTLVESQIEAALDALRRRDGSGAEEVGTQDQDLDELFRQIREQVFMVISTQQPVARDLRYL